MLINFNILKKDIKYFKILKLKLINKKTKYSNKIKISILRILRIILILRILSVIKFW